MDELSTLPASANPETAQPPVVAKRPRRGMLSIHRLSLIGAILLAFTFGMGAGYAFWGLDLGRKAAQATAASGGGTDQSGVPAQVKRYDVPVDDDPTLGPEDAEITLVEFSDFECPYCQAWQQQVFGRLKQDYQGSIRFVYRDFPLTSIHPNALEAAQAANCAYEQDKFWEYHDKLFESGLGTAAYIRYAEELDLDMDAFKECLDSGRYLDEVMADLDWASNLGVRSTPTFFLNGIPIVGAQPYEVFKQVVDQELAGEIP
jgi:protein-disulfide isomerase